MAGVRVGQFFPVSGFDSDYRQNCATPTDSNCGLDSDSAVLVLRVQKHPLGTEVHRLRWSKTP